MSKANPFALNRLQAYRFTELPPEPKVIKLKHERMLEAGFPAPGPFKGLYLFHKFILIIWVHFHNLAHQTSSPLDKDTI